MASAMLLLEASCSDDSSGASSGTPEAGTDVSAPDSAGSDGGGSDATSEDPATLGPVTARVRDLGGPFAGVKVYFQVAGAFEEATTDASGLAMHQGGAVDSVTAVLTGPTGGTWIETAVGGAPGEVLDFVVAGDRRPDLTVSTKAAAPDASVDNVRAFFCDANHVLSPGTSEEWSAPRYCVNAANGVDVYFAAENAGVAQAVATKPALADGSAYAVDLAGAEWSSPATANLVLSGNANGTGTNLFAMAVVTKDNRTLDYGKLNQDVVAPYSAIPFRKLPAGGANAIRLVISEAGPTANAASNLWASVPVPSGDITQDLGALMPFITSASIGGTAASPTLVYATQASVSGVVGAHVVLTKKGDAGADVSMQWAVRVPVTTAGTLTLPALPPAIASMLPVDFAWDATPEMSLVASPQIATFEKFRTLSALAFFYAEQIRGLAPVLPGSYTVTDTRWARSN